MLPDFREGSQRKARKKFNRNTRCLQHPFVVESEFWKHCALPWKPGRSASTCSRIHQPKGRVEATKGEEATANWMKGRHKRGGTETWPAGEETTR